MKIIHVIDYFQPKLGYQEYFLAKYQKKLGHNVCVVTSDRYFPFDNYQNLFGHVLGKRILKPGKFVERGVDVYRLPVFFEYKTVIIIRNLYKILQKLKPDLVFMHNMMGSTAIQVALFKDKLRYKLFYDTHTSELNTDFKSSLFRKIYYSFFVKKAVKFFIRKKADKIIAIGEDEHNLVTKTYGLNSNEVPIIRLGVDTEAFHPNKKERKGLRKKLNFKDTDKIVIFTGKISPEKEVDVLIKLMQALKRDDVKLLLVGSAGEDYKLKLVNLIDKLEVKDKIRWVEMVPQEELPGYYQIADIAIWPGNPTMARFEALSSGLPVIVATGIESAKDIIAAGAALDFKRGDITDLEKKVNFLINNPTKYAETSRKAIKLIKNNYAWQKIAKNIINF